MPVHLTVYTYDEKELVSEKDYDNSVISIGRDHSCQLNLKDTKKIVSRTHAEIQFQDGAYYLVDKDSRNGTYINNRRIKANYPYTLDEGAEFVIGEYVIQFNTVEKRAIEESPPEVPKDRTVFYSNPFQEEIESLIEVLEKIEHKHTRQREIATKESLQELIASIQSKTSGFETAAIIGAGLNANISTGQDITSAPRHPDQAARDPGNTGKVLDTLLELFISLVRFMSKFRTEFVGNTMISQDSGLDAGSVTEIKSYLFDPEITTEEAQKRVQHLTEQTRTLIGHQIGLLEGYKESINKGTHELMKKMNPSIIKNRIANSPGRVGPLKVPLKFIPFLPLFKTFGELEKRHFELSNEDRGVVEKKIFRPPFIRKYFESIQVNDADTP